MIKFQRKLSAGWSSLLAVLLFGGLVHAEKPVFLRSSGLGGAPGPRGSRKLGYESSSKMYMMNKMFNAGRMMSSSSSSSSSSSWSMYTYKNELPDKLKMQANENKLSKKAKAQLKASEGFRDAITVDGMYDHLMAFETIGIINGGTRYTGTDGFTDSVTYTVHVLEEAGLDVRVQEFPAIVYLFDVATLSSESQTFVLYQDFDYFDFSASANTTGPAQFVNNFGCDEADFADFTSGSVAIIERGDCLFAQKILNSQNAGAVGVIIYNDEARQEIFVGTIGYENVGVLTIPVMSAPYSFSGAISEGEILNMAVNATTTEFTSQNVIAEYVVAKGEPFILVGSHLDSAPETPGIHESGSGCALTIEMAINIVGFADHLANNVRFAFWGASTAGTIGSDYYLRSSSDEEYFGIALYLNLEFIGSHNYMRYIYEAGTDKEIPIRQLFVDYHEYAGLTYVPEGFSFYSDIEAKSDGFNFRENEIAVGGVFTGSLANKTQELFELFGGKVGVSFDECFRATCDTIDNVNLEVLDQMADATAHTFYTLATLPGLNLTELASEYMMESHDRRRGLTATNKPRTHFDNKGGLHEER